MGISFAKVPGAGQSAPVQPANAEVVDETNTPAPTNTSTAVATRPVYTPGFHTGADDDEEPADEGSGKVRNPYLNLVQPTSKDIKNVASEGDFVLGKTTKIPAGSRAVVVGFGNTFYREKVKYNGPVQAREVYSLADVQTAGGTTGWRESKENAGDNGGSKKPWFMPAIKALLLIEKPEDADEAFFPHVVEGKAYAACVFEVKSTAYDSFYVELNSKRKTTNLFKGGWAARFIKLTSRKGKGDDASFKPVPEILEAAPAEFIALAKKVASGN
jgi:hypothetical protein